MTSCYTYRSDIAIAPPISSTLSRTHEAAFNEAFARDDAVRHFTETYENSAKFLRRTPARYMSYLRFVVCYALFLQDGQTQAEHVRKVKGAATPRKPSIIGENAIAAYKPAVPTTVYAAENEASRTR